MPPADLWPCASPGLWFPDDPSLVYQVDVWHLLVPPDSNEMATSQPRALTVLALADVKAHSKLFLVILLVSNPEGYLPIFKVKGLSISSLVDLDFIGTSIFLKEEEVDLP